MTSPASSSPGLLRCGIRRWARRGERMFAIIGVLLVGYHLTLMESVIVSPSMSPTLQGQSWSDGDHVLTERVSYWFRQLRRWEIVAFRRSDGVVVMKRVVGLPGGSVSLRKNGELIINGNVVPQPAALEHIRYFPIGLVNEDRAVNCGAGYFVLGDDSKDSEDSRYEGPILPASIIGRAWMIIRPWSRMGWVN